MGARTIETRLRALEKRTRQLYHRTYAVTMRADRVKKARSVHYGRLTRESKLRNVRTARYLRNLGPLLKQLKAGRSIVILSRTEKMKLMARLRRDDRFR